MKNLKIYLLAFLVVAFISSFYFVGCEQNSMEPIKNNDQTQLLSKLSKTTDIDLKKRNELRLKFIKEVSEAKIRIRAKYAKLRNSNKHQVNALPLYEQEAIEFAASVTPSAYSYVASAYNVNLYDYFSVDDPNIAIVGMIVSNVEGDNSNGIYYEEINDPLPLYKGSLNKSVDKSPNKVLARPIWLDCLLEAAGIGDITAIWGAGGYLGLRAAGVTKLAARVFAKYLTGAAAAIAALDFAWCMWRES